MSDVAVKRRRRLGGVRTGIALLLAVYVAGAVAGNALVPRGEIFPVFSWSLFSRVYPSVGLVELELIELNGETLTEPIAFFDLGDRFAKARAGDVTVTKMLNRIVYRQRRGLDTEPLLKRLQADYLAEARSATYRIAIVWFEPLERVRTGTVIKRDVLYEGAFGGDNP